MYSAIQVEDRGVVVDSDFAGRIHPEGVADDVVCRGPSGNKEEQLDEMNGEQGTAEGRAAEPGGSLIMLDHKGPKRSSSLWDNQK